MPGSITRPSVDRELLEELRSKFSAALSESDPDLYHPDDIARVKENDWFLTRYLLHSHKDVDKSLKLLIESLKWRKEYEANTVSRATLPPEAFNIRATNVYSRDNKGRPLIAIRTKMHFKDEKLKRTQILYTVYFFEKAIRKSDWGTITVLFDCEGSGVANMDLDMIRFILNMFKKNYPWALGDFIVYNLPWYLSGIWKIVKRWIPEHYVSKVNFVDQTTIQDFINPDQLPIALGGTCTKLYEPKEGAEVPDDDDEVFTREQVEC